jgi:hypothetical protein
MKKFAMLFAVLAIVATGTMASKCEVNMPQNTDTSTTP